MDDLTADIEKETHTHTHTHIPTRAYTYTYTHTHTHTHVQSKKLNHTKRKRQIDKKVMEKIDRETHSNRQEDRKQSTGLAVKCK